MSEQDARARAIAEQARQIANRWWRSRDASPDAEAPESLAEAIAVALSATADTARKEGWQAGYSASEQTYAGTVKKLAVICKAAEEYVAALHTVASPGSTVPNYAAINIAEEALDAAVQELRARATPLAATADTARAQGEREAFKAGFLALIENRDENGEPLRPSRWTFTGRSVAHDLEPEAYDAWLRARATAGDTP